MRFVRRNRDSRETSIGFGRYISINRTISRISRDRHDSYPYFSHVLRCFGTMESTVANSIEIPMIRIGIQCCVHNGDLKNSFRRTSTVSFVRFRASVLYRLDRNTVVRALSLCLYGRSVYKPRARSYVRNSHQSIGIICLFLASIVSVNDARVTRSEKFVKI